MKYWSNSYRWKFVIAYLLNRLKMWKKFDASLQSLSTEVRKPASTCSAIIIIKNNYRRHRLRMEELYRQLIEFRKPYWMTVKRCTKYNHKVDFCFSKTLRLPFSLTPFTLTYFTFSHFFSFPKFNLYNKLESLVVVFTCRKKFCISKRLIWLTRYRK